MYRTGWVWAVTVLWRTKVELLGCCGLGCLHVCYAAYMPDLWLLKILDFLWFMWMNAWILQMLCAHTHAHTHTKISGIALVSIFGEAETSESKTWGMLNSQILTALTNTWRKATTGSSPKQMWVTLLKQLSCSHSEITHVVYPIIQLG